MTDNTRAVGLVSMHTSPVAQAGQGDSGGMNVVLRELGFALAQRGIDVRCYTRNLESRTAVAEVLEPNFTIVKLPAGPPQIAKDELIGHIDEFSDALGADIADHPRDVLHAHYWLSGLATRRVVQRVDVPTAITFHTLGRVKQAAGDAEPAVRIDAEAELVDTSDLLCASSSADRNDLINHYSANPDKVVITHPGVIHAFFSPGSQRGARHALGLSDSYPTLLFVGRVQRLKGLDLVLEALGHLKRFGVRLFVIGGPSGSRGDEEMDRCRRLIAGLGIGDLVRFIPPQPHHLLATYYRASDLCVVPSRSESFGLVALEAASCGIPVVASRVGGLVDVVSPEVSGVLLETRDPMEWAAKIAQLLGLGSLVGDRSDGGQTDDRRSGLPDGYGAAALRRRQLGDAAARRAAKFTWGETAAQLVRSYDRLLHAHSTMAPPGAVPAEQHQGPASETSVPALRLSARKQR